MSTLERGLHWPWAVLTMNNGLEVDSYIGFIHLVSSSQWPAFSYHSISLDSIHRFNKQASSNMLLCLKSFLCFARALMVPGHLLAIEEKRQALEEDKLLQLVKYGSTMLNTEPTIAMMGCPMNTMAGKKM